MSTEVMSLDDALASGDQAAIDAALKANGHDPFSEQDEADAGDIGTAATDDLEADDGKKPLLETGKEVGADDGDTGESNGEPSGQTMEVKKVVKSKDGEHEIPYEVLEQSRKREREAQDRADELQRQLNEANSKVSETQKQLNNAKSQFEDRGLSADEMFSDPDSITEAELKELEADYGKSSAQAKMARRLYVLQQEQVSNVEQAETVAEDSANATEQEAAKAFRSNTELTDWQQNDSDRWEAAVAIDVHLQADPTWSGKSAAERFAEVARRTKVMFGDAVDTPQEKSGKDRAQEIIDKTNPDVPDSLSDIGQAPAAEKSLAERLGEMSDADREAAMANLSDSELQRLMDA